MKKIKTVIALIMILVLLSSCGGAGTPQTQPQTPQQTKTEEPQQTQDPATTPADTQTPEPEKTQPEEPKPSYASQPKLRTASYNPLTVTEHSETRSEDSDGAAGSVNMYFSTIEGLSDPEVESRINGDIIGIYNRAVRWEIPPFRGTANVDPAKYEKGSKYFNLTVDWNYNDYLSYIGWSSIYSESDGTTFCDYYPAVYDLRSGKKLALKDIFAEGYPYEEVINRKVLEYLRKIKADDETRDPDGYSEDDYYEYYEDTSVKLVSPFKGIREDQGFILTDYGLKVILDYNNRELDFTGNYVCPAMVEISFSEFEDGLLLSRDCDPSVYRDKVGEGKKLLSGLGGEEVYEKTKLYDGPYHIYYEEELRYPELAPKEMIDMVHDLQKEQRVPLGPYIKACEEAPNPGDKYYYFNCYAYINMIGDYYSVSVYSDAPAVEDDGEYISGSFDGIYDSNFKLLEPKDMFQEGFDWVSFLSSAFEENIEREKEYGAQAEEQPDCRAMAESATVSISNDSVYFNSSITVPMHNYNWDYDFDYRPSCSVDFKSDDVLLLRY